MEDDLEPSIIKTFRNSGYKATPQRIAISRYILSSDEHPTAQKVYLEIKKTNPTVSLATIYRTINILKDAGLILELNMHQGETRFDPVTEPHAHLLCLRCGRIDDWTDPMMPKLIDKASAAEHFIVTCSNFELKGICDGCAKMGCGADITP